MTPYVISKKSWHYWLVTKFTRYIDTHGFTDSPYEICSYWRAVTFGMLILSIFSALAGFLVACEVELVLHIVRALQGSTLTLEKDPMACVGLSILIVAALIGLSIGIAILLEWRRDRKYANEYYYRQRQPGFIKLAYRSWKDKYCTKIVFVSNDLVQSENSDS